MPILHTQFRAQGKNKQGQVVPIPPGVVLQKQGPVLQVTIGLAQSIAAQLLQQGKTLPKPVSGVALIDTVEFPPCVRHIFLILRWTFSKEEMSYVQRAEKVLS